MPGSTQWCKENISTNRSAAFKKRTRAAFLLPRFSLIHLSYSFFKYFSLTTLLLKPLYVQFLCTVFFFSCARRCHTLQGLLCSFVPSNLFTQSTCSAVEFKAVYHCTRPLSRYQAVNLISRDTKLHCNISFWRISAAQQLAGSIRFF